MKTIMTWRISLLGERLTNSFVKGRTRAVFAIVFIWLAAFSLASCNSDNDDVIKDGDWPPMEWKAEMPIQTTDGVLYVSATGTELTFSCLNYPSVWIADAVLDGEYYDSSDGINDIRTISADWVKAEVNGNILKVVFDANKTKNERTLVLTVTAGDIFYTFNFKQFTVKSPLPSSS